MRLDRCLGDAEFVGNLLVQQPLAKHGQHPALLRCQRVQAMDEVGDIGVLFLSVALALRRRNVAREHCQDATADILDA